MKTVAPGCAIIRFSTPSHQHQPGSIFPVSFLISWHCRAHLTRMSHQSPWDPPLFPFLGDLESLFDFTSFPVPDSLCSPFPGRCETLPISFDGDFTARAVFDFFEDGPIEFDDISGLDDVNFQSEGGLKTETFAPSLEPAPHTEPQFIQTLAYDEALGALTQQSGGIGTSDFEQRVLALLDPMLGTAAEGDLEIECLDSEQENILTRISRERGRAIRFEASRYPNHPRVAIIPRDTARDQTQYLASSANWHHPLVWAPVDHNRTLPAITDPTWPDYTAANVRSSEQRGQRQQLSSASLTEGLQSWEATSLHTPSLDDTPIPQTSQVAQSTGADRDSVKTIQPSSDQRRSSPCGGAGVGVSIKRILRGGSKSQGEDHMSVACWPCRLTRKKVSTCYQLLLMIEREC